MARKKVIVCGGRDFNNYDLLKTTLDELYGNQDIEIVSGGQITKPDLNGKPNPDPKTWYGADWFGIRYSREELGQEPTIFYAEWKKFGGPAGPIRNNQMGNYCAGPANDCVACWDTKSRGTGGMINIATERRINVHIVNY